MILSISCSHKQCEWCQFYITRIFGTFLNKFPNFLEKHQIDEVIFWMERGFVNLDTRIFKFCSGIYRINCLWTRKLATYVISNNFITNRKQYEQFYDSFIPETNGWCFVCPQTKTCYLCFILRIRFKLYCSTRFSFQYHIINLYEVKRRTIKRFFISYLETFSKDIIILSNCQWRTWIM